MATFTLRLVDQDGNPLSSSRYWLGQADSQGKIHFKTTEPHDFEEQVDVPPGLYTLRAFPRQDLFENGNMLFRDHEIEVVGDPAKPKVIVDGKPHVLDHETSVALLWRTELFELELCDFATRDPIPASVFYVAAGINTSQGIVKRLLGSRIENGEKSLPLPVTEDHEQPPVRGWNSGGYLIRSMPGAFGKSYPHEFGAPYRYERVQLTAGGVNRPELLWKHAELEVRIVDQDGASLPDATFGIYDGYNRFLVELQPNGTSVRLPVSQDPAFDDSVGRVYRIRLRPYVGPPFGQSSLWRWEGPVELTPKGARLSFEWERVQCRPVLRNKGGHAVPAAKVWFEPLPEEPVSELDLPVNDPSSYPNMAGPLVDNGYLFGIQVGNSPTLFHHERVWLLPGAGFRPAQVTVGAASFAITCAEECSCHGEQRDEPEHGA